MILSLLTKITLEPTVFLQLFGVEIVRGAQITTDLLIWKICHIKLNYSEVTCANLTNEGRDKYSQSKIETLGPIWKVSPEYYNTIKLLVFLQHF